MSAECRICGTTFKPLRPTHTCCSAECRNALLRTYAADREHQSRAGARGGEVTGQARTARARAEGYKGYVKGHRTDTHEHRLVAERVLGRALTSVEVVHHEDEDKTNNRPGNLIVFPTQAAHAAHHQLGHPGNGPCDCAGAIRLEGRDA